MRNANVDGQALGPIEFPFKECPIIGWSARYPVYEKRMKAISSVCVGFAKSMADQNNEAVGRASGNPSLFC